jgi:hypothetical protein
MNERKKKRRRKKKKRGERMKKKKKALQTHILDPSLDRGYIDRQNHLSLN